MRKGKKLWVLPLGLGFVFGALFCLVRPSNCQGAFVIYI